MQPEYMILALTSRRDVQNNLEIKSNLNNSSIRVEIIKGVLLTEKQSKQVRKLSLADFLTY